MENNLSENQIKPEEDFLNIMKNAFTNLTEITNKYQFSSYDLDLKDSFKLEKLFIKKSSNSDFRIFENSEIKFFYQKYLINSKTQDLFLINKEYKNIIKKKISEMKLQEKILRKLLLDMMSDEINVFKVDKLHESDNYQQAINSLPKFLVRFIYNRLKI